MATPTCFLYNEVSYGGYYHKNYLRNCNELTVFPGILAFLWNCWLLQRELTKSIKIIFELRYLLETRMKSVVKSSILSECSFSHEKTFFKETSTYKVFSVII